MYQPHSCRGFKFWCWLDEEDTNTCNKSSWHGHNVHAEWGGWNKKKWGTPSKGVSVTSSSCFPFQSNRWWGRHVLGRREGGGGGRIRALWMSGLIHPLWRWKLHKPSQNMETSTCNAFDFKSNFRETSNYFGGAQLVKLSDPIIICILVHAYLDTEISEVRWYQISLWWNSPPCMLPSIISIE